MVGHDESRFRDRGTKRNDDGTGKLLKKVDKKVVIVEYSKKSRSRKVAAMMCHKTTMVMTMLTHKERERERERKQ